MFTTTPWTDYVLIVCALLTGYYLFVGFKFYRDDLRSWIKDRRNRSHHRRFKSTALSGPDPPGSDTIIQEDENASEHIEEELPAWQNETLFSQLEELAAQLKDAIGEAFAKQYEKQDLILLIRMTLKDYPALFGPPFRFAINNLIESECAKLGSINLSADDKVMIWKQVD